MTSSRKENLKALFQNTKTRTIILFTFAILFIVIMIGVVRFLYLSRSSVDLTTETSLKRAPANIQSIPGSLNQTAQYAALQQAQNIEQATQAEQKGFSAIPTIIRAQAFGEGVDSIGPQNGQGGVGFSTLALAQNIGGPQSLWVEDLEKHHCDKATLDRVLSQGATLHDIHPPCSCDSLHQHGFSLKDLRTVCRCPELKAAGFGAHDLKNEGYDALQLKQCGFSACEVRGSAFTAAEMKRGGYSDGELEGAGFTPDLIAKAVAEVAQDIPAGMSADDIKKVGCGLDALKALKAKGVSAETIQKYSGCTLDALKQAGFILKTSAHRPQDYRCDVVSLKAAHEAGVSAKAIHDTLGCSLAMLKAAGFTPEALAGLENPAQTMNALDVGSSENHGSSVMNTFPSFGTTPAGSGALSSGALPLSSAQRAQQQQTQQIENMVQAQQKQAAIQRYQAQIKQKSAVMTAAAKEALQEWKKTSEQVFVLSNQKEEGGDAMGASPEAMQMNKSASTEQTTQGHVFSNADDAIKTGDILFAVMDTSVNSDEPGPILATVVSGRLKGSKLIGSFTLPSNASKMVILFNTLSVPGKDKSISISAYAIDPNTARTALSSETNHHYLQRYGALFASSFMSGMSSAIQSANTTVSVGGTGGVTNTTVSTIGRSTIDNALIALGEVGKAWSKTAQKEMNRPTTVQVYAGVGLGVLFTQDVAF